MARENKASDTHLAAPTQEEKEEISFLRQKCTSMMMRGHYKECFKLIEENLKLLYFKERWPENFYASLVLHKRSYASMGIDATYEEYLENLLKKRGIPHVFSSLLKGSATSVDWSADYFKQLAIVSESKQDYDDALAYADLMVKQDPLNSSAYLMRGWMLEAKELEDEAAACYERALELNRTNYQAYCSLAEYHMKRDPKKALENIESAIEQAPGEASFWAVKAKILNQEGGVKGAIDAYNEAIARAPDNVDYCYEMAELQLKDGQELAAIRTYGKAVGMDPGHVPSLMRLAVLMEENQPELALPYVNTVVTAQPKNREALLLKARLTDRTGETLAAIRQYKQLLEEDPDCAEAHAALGRLYLLDDAERASRHYQKAVDIVPNNGDYHVGKAQALQKLGDNEGAVQAFKTAVTVDKRCARAYAALGDLHRETDPKAAIGYYDKAFALKPDNAYYVQSKGELMLQTSGNKQAALECYKQALQIDPANATLHVYVGALMEDMGNTASATDHYRKAINLDTDQHRAYYGLAKLLMDSQPDMALLYINTAIDLSANIGDYYYIKGKILASLGRDKDAIRQLMRTLAEDGGNTQAMEEIALLMQEDTPRVALLYLNRAIEMMPDNAVYLCDRANLLHSLGEAKKALEQFLQAESMDANCYQAVWGAANIFAERQDPRAMEYYDRAIALKADVADHHAGKAALLRRNADNYDAAIACYNDAIRCDNQRWDILLDKASLLEAHGDVLAAMEDYRHVLLIQPENLTANARLGILIVDLNPGAAIRYLSKAEQLEPGNYLYQIWLGRAAHLLGDDEAAENAYRHALELGSDSDEVYYTLAEALYKRLPESGLKYIREAIDRNPQNAQYPLLCGKIHLLLGERNEAQGCFERALQLDPKCHQAHAALAKMRFQAEDPACLELIDAALQIEPDNGKYLHAKAEMLVACKQDLPGAIACLRKAVKVRPAIIENRELLVELLGKHHKPLQKMLEKRKLEKLRSQTRQAEQQAREEKTHDGETSPA